MNIIRLSKFYESYFISFIFIINYVNNAIIKDNYDDSIFLENVTDDYRSWNVSMRFERQITNSDCKIPNYPNAAYKIIDDPETPYKTGDYVNQFSILKIICDEGYNLPPFTPATFFCNNGKWDQPPPTCIRACPSLRSTTSTTVTCKYKDETILLDNCINPIDGTTVHLSCNIFYESDDIKKNPNRFCNQGKWSSEFPQCSAICGLKSPKSKFNIINGNDSTPGDYPWQVGIYTNTKKYLCGGAIIDQKIILSAAHCFTNNQYKAHPVENYLIAAGKYYSQYADARDKLVQYSKVHQILIQERYKGSSSVNMFDIAIVVLKDPFTLTVGVLPVCIDLYADPDNEDYFTNNYGIVTGWGYTQEDSIDPSAELKESRVPYISYNMCYQNVPPTFQKFVAAFDKICGGFINEGTSPCQGDSGSALVNNKNNYYFIIGIVSTSPVSLKTGVTSCNSQQYSLYTSVNQHIHFIRTAVFSHGWKQSIKCTGDDCTSKEIERRHGCLLPDFPQHGKFSFSDKNHKYRPGNYVQTNSVISLRCDIGYTATFLSVTKLFTCIENGTWNSELRSCKPFQFNFQNTSDLMVLDLNSRNTESDPLTYEYDKSFNYFDLELLQIFSNNEENYLISPAGIKIILAMLLEGSNGKSTEVISKILHIPVDINISRRILNTLINELSEKFGSTVFNVGNLFALSNKYIMRQEYRRILKLYYHAQTANVDFSKSIQFTSYLNNWAKSATHGFINEIISAENIKNDASLIITNTVFFKAQWKTEFIEKVTKFTYMDKFERINEHYVEALQVKGQFRYKYFQILDTQVVELPYSDKENAMAIFLPALRQTVSSLQKDLKRVNFASTIDSLTATDVLISLPKFDIECGTNLKMFLEKTEVKEIFSKSANLSGIFVEEREAKIDDIFHKVRVEINEKGTLTTASQINLFEPSLESVIANRPFLFFIYNIKSKHILFEGRLNSPSPLYDFIPSEN